MEINDPVEILLVEDNPTDAELTMVALTSSREDRDMIESYNLGVNSYVTKPVEFEAFVKIVSGLGLYWLLINQSLFHPVK